jgi:hypothetical protein
MAAGARDSLPPSPARNGRRAGSSRGQPLHVVLPLHRRRAAPRARQPSSRSPALGGRHKPPGGAMGHQGPRGASRGCLAIEPLDDAGLHPACMPLPRARRACARRNGCRAASGAGPVATARPRPRGKGPWRGRPRTEAARAGLGRAGGAAPPRPRLHTARGAQPAPTWAPGIRCPRPRRALWPSTPPGSGERAGAGPSAPRRPVAGRPGAPPGAGTGDRGPVSDASGRGVPLRGGPRGAVGADGTGVEGRRRERGRGGAVGGGGRGPARRDGPGAPRRGEVRAVRGAAGARVGGPRRVAPPPPTAPPAAPLWLIPQLGALESDITGSERRSAAPDAWTDRPALSPPGQRGARQVQCGARAGPGAQENAP